MTSSRARGRPVGKVETNIHAGKIPPPPMDKVKVPLLSMIEVAQCVRPGIYLMHMTELDAIFIKNGKKEIGRVEVGPLLPLHLQLCYRGVRILWEQILKNKVSHQGDTPV